jgi:hypothetical protein
MKIIQYSFTLYDHSKSGFPFVLNDTQGEWCNIYKSGAKRVQTRLISADMKTKGYIHKNYTQIAESFSKNFEEYGEIGASLCVYHKNEKVIDTKLDINTIQNRSLIDSIIAEQRPHWQPGDYQGYHVWNIGWYISSLLKRIDPIYDAV